MNEKIKKQKVKMTKSVDRLKGEFCDQGRQSKSGST